jgi:hypothetical protein
MSKLIDFRSKKGVTKLDRLVEAYLVEVSTGWVMAKNKKANKKLLEFPGMFMSGWAKKMGQLARITHKNIIKDFGKYKRASSGKKYEEILVKYDKLYRGAV